MNSQERVKAEEALGRIAARAALGDRIAWLVLNNISKGASRMARPALVIIKLWLHLKPLAELPDQLSMVNSAAAIVQEERDLVLQGLMSGEVSPNVALTQRLGDFFSGPYSMPKAIHNLWMQQEGYSREATVIMHDRVARLMGGFRLASFSSPKRVIDSVSLIANCIQGSGVLSGIVHSAIYENFIGIAAKNIHFELMFQMMFGFQIRGSMGFWEKSLASS